MIPKTRVKERAEEQAGAMSPSQKAVIRLLADQLHRLNQAVIKAEDSGVSVELVRTAPPSWRGRLLGRSACSRHRNKAERACERAELSFQEEGMKASLAGPPCFIF